MPACHGANTIWSTTEVLFFLMTVFGDVTPGCFFPKHDFTQPFGRFRQQEVDLALRSNTWRTSWPQHGRRVRTMMTAGQVTVPSPHPLPPSHRVLRSSTLPSLSLRNTDQGVQHKCQFLRSVSRHNGPRSRHVWIGGELWMACEGTGVSTGGRAHSSSSFAVRTKQSTTCIQVLCECLAVCLAGNRP